MAYEPIFKDRFGDGAYTFSALATMGQIERDERVLAELPALAEAARVVGSVQVRNRATPPFEKADERVVHDFAKALHIDRKVPQALYDEAVAVLGVTRVVELVGILGYYTLISMTINAFNVPLEGDLVPELE